MIRCSAASLSLLSGATSEVSNRLKAAATSCVLENIYRLKKLKMYFIISFFFSFFCHLQLPASVATQETSCKPERTPETCHSVTPNGAASCQSEDPFFMSRVAATETERRIISPALFFSVRVSLSCNSEHRGDRELLTRLPEERGGRGPLKIY